MSSAEEVMELLNFGNQMRTVAVGMPVGGGRGGGHDCSAGRAILQEPMSNPRCKPYMGHF